VAIDFGKAGLDQGGGKVADFIGAKAMTNLASEEMVRQNAEVAVRRNYDILGRRSITVANAGKRSHQLAQAQTKLGQAKANATRAAMAKNVARGVGYALAIAFPRGISWTLSRTTRRR